MTNRIDPVKVYETILDDWNKHFPHFKDHVIFYDVGARRDGSKEVAQIEKEIKKRSGQDIHLHDQLSQTLSTMIRGQNPHCAPLVSKFGQQLPAVYVMGFLNEPTVSTLLSKMSGIKADAIKHDFDEDDPIFHEMIYHHELGHAQMRLHNASLPAGKDPTSYDECVADSYAVLRIVHKYGEKGMKAARLWLDARAVAGLSYGSFSHYTSEALYHAIDAMTQAGAKKVQSMKPEDLFEAAVEMSVKPSLGKGAWQMIDQRSLKLGTITPSHWDKRLKDPNHIFMADQKYRDQTTKSLKRFSKAWKDEDHVDINIMRSIDLDNMANNLAMGAGVGRLVQAFAAIASGHSAASIERQIEQDAKRRNRSAIGGFGGLSNSFNKKAALREAHEELNIQYQQIIMNLQQIDPALLKFVVKECKADAKGFFEKMSNPANWKALVTDLIEKQREHTIKVALGQKAPDIQLSPAWVKAPVNDNAHKGKVIKGPWSRKFA